jgi:hypothetical protein
MKQETQVLCIISVAILGGFIVLGYQQAATHRRGLVSAVARQVDGHSEQITELLTTMRGSNVTEIADAAFQELQAMPSTSLITRSMVKVTPGTNGNLECVIDTCSLGIEPRTIRGSR